MCSKHSWNLIWNKAMIVCLFDFSRYMEADITPQEILGGNKVITASERLAVTLRFLATGETYRSLSF